MKNIMTTLLHAYVEFNNNLNTYKDK